MARVELIFEDAPEELGGKGVVVKSIPDNKTLLSKMKRKEGLTNAEALAAIALGAVAKSSMQGEIADNIRGIKSVIEI